MLISQEISQRVSPLNSDHLNPQQKVAVEHGTGPLLVLAGAGSGKTRVITMRIARLVADGASPSQILAVTFTNKAADEMRRRVESLIGKYASDVALGTFHATSLRILREHGERIGLGPHFRVFDDTDSRTLVGSCLEALNLSEKRFPPSAVGDRISRAKDRCEGPAVFEAHAAAGYLSIVAKIYTRYQQELEKMQAADFGDLIRLTVELFEKHPDVLAHYRRRWKHFLVDEYQDTNHAQYRLMKLLADDGQHLCVVGDDDQSIYRWRGADVSNILNFERDFLGSRVVKLEQNYRSTQSILDAASSVISKNTGRKGKTLWTENPQGEPLSLVRSASEREEAGAILRAIESFRAQGKTYGDVAIFYRTNAQSRPFEEVFREHSVPYRIFGGIRFYERREIKDIISYLRVIASPHDDVALERILNVPPRGLGKTTLIRLKQYVAEQHTPIFPAIPHFLSLHGCRKGQQTALQSFYDVVQSLQQTAHTRPLRDLLHDVLEKSGYVDMLTSEGTIEAESRLENINELVAAAEEFQSPKNTATSELVCFLDQVALVSSADEVDAEEGAVTFMTLHLAKGLEFPFVCMVGMEEGLLPHARSLDDPDELEEERRLCYVGMTRAQQRLLLSSALRRSIFGSTRYAIPSRFLDEFPDGVVTCDSSLAARNADHEFDFDQREQEERVSLFSSGTRVHHPMFGRGVIRKCERSSSGHRVTVQFENGYTKRLIAEFAGLVSL